MMKSVWKMITDGSLRLHKEPALPPKPLCIMPYDEGAVVLLCDSAGRLRLRLLDSPTTENYACELKNNHFNLKPRNWINFRFCPGITRHFLTCQEKTPTGNKLVILSTQSGAEWKIEDCFDNWEGPALIVEKNRGKPLLISLDQSSHEGVTNKYNLVKLRVHSEHGGETPILIETFPIKDFHRCLYYTTTRTEHGHVALSVMAVDVQYSEGDVSTLPHHVPAFSAFFRNHRDCEFLGGGANKESITYYWLLDGSEVAILTFPLESIKFIPKKVSLLNKHENNPIITPRPGQEWERWGTFNPAVLQLGNAIHILYRAVGSDGVSTVGYAQSQDGVSFDQRPNFPVYFPRETFEGGYGNFAPDKKSIYQSGPGWGGCEDPKVTYIPEDGLIYMTYVAFNGWSNPRVAITSIPVDDFLNQDWNWAPPVIMSKPTETNKSAVILPQKINNKYVIFHRVFPNIQIDIRDNLDFSNNNWLKTEATIPISSMWDTRKVSIGATPILIDEGWLTVYHAVDDRHPRDYQIGIMLLDKDDPSKVLYRTRHPVLSPTHWYENRGKPGVAYPSGAAIVNGNLNVYYGGGDDCVCLAQLPLSQVLTELKEHKVNPSQLAYRPVVI